MLSIKVCALVLMFFGNPVLAATKAVFFDGGSKVKPEKALLDAIRGKTVLRCTPWKSNSKQILLVDGHEVKSQDILRCQPYEAVLSASQTSIHLKKKPSK